MRALPILFISIVFLGCNTPKNSSNKIEQKAKTIIGTWEFISVEVIEPNPSPDLPVFQPKSDSTYNVLQLFGAETIHNSPGKTISFTVNNKIKSNLVSQDLLDQLNLKYQFDDRDSLITFTFIHPKDSSNFYTPTKAILRDSSMTWNIDDFIEINLHRVK